MEPLRPRSRLGNAGWTCGSKGRGSDVTTRHMQCKTDACEKKSADRFWDGESMQSAKPDLHVRDISDECRRLHHHDCRRLMMHPAAIASSANVDDEHVTSSERYHFAGRVFSCATRMRVCSWTYDELPPVNILHPST
eukprot:354411-Chlamydomonas_euryale.AAC.15